jgi:hypothetical protein
MVRLTFKPAGATLRPVVLVGKGVTYDTGGASHFHACKNAHFGLGSGTPHVLPSHKPGFVSKRGATRH